MGNARAGPARAAPPPAAPPPTQTHERELGLGRHVVVAGGARGALLVNGRALRRRVLLDVLLGALEHARACERETDRMGWQRVRQVQCAARGGGPRARGLPRARGGARCRAPLTPRARRGLLDLALLRDRRRQRIARLALLQHALGDEPAAGGRGSGGRRRAVAGSRRAGRTASGRGRRSTQKTSSGSGFDAAAAHAST
jgi:hypothetical protein